MADQGRVMAEAHVLDRLAARADGVDPVPHVRARRVLVVRRRVLHRRGGVHAVERRELVVQVHQFLELRCRRLRPGLRRVAEAVRFGFVEELEGVAVVLERARVAVEGQQRPRVAVERRAGEPEHEAVRVLHHRSHLVWNLAVVLPAVDVREGEDALGLLDPHQLVRGRDEMDEQIGGEAARVVPVETPLEEAAQVEVARRRGAEEPLEVHRRWRGVGRDGVVPGARGGVAVDLALDQRHLPQPAAPDELGCPLRAAHAHVLAADLDHLAALLGGRDERLALFPRMGHRLLDVDVLAGGQRLLRHLEVPVIGRGDDDGVDVGAGDDLGVVAGDGWRRSEQFQRPVEMPLVAVGDCDNLRAADPRSGLHQQRAADPGANEPQANRLGAEAGRVVDLRAGVGRGADRGGSRGEQRGLLKKLPSVHRGVGCHGCASAGASSAHAMRPAKEVSMFRQLRRDNGRAQGCARRAGGSIVAGEIPLCGSVTSRSVSVSL